MQKDLESNYKKQKLFPINNRDWKKKPKLEILQLFFALAFYD